MFAFLRARALAGAVVAALLVKNLFRRRPAVQARSSRATLAHRQCRFAADNLGALRERPSVVDLIVAIVGALRSALRPRASLVRREPRASATTRRTSSRKEAAASR
jgi:hypothetical protein